MIAASVLQSPVAIETTTYVSFAVLIVVIGAAWRFGVALGRIEEQLRNQSGQITGLSTLPERFGRLEVQVEKMKDDLDAAWDELKAHRERKP